VNDGFWYDAEYPGDKGEHGYPYFYQVVAYDMNKLVDVKNGILQPWDPRPYDYWTFTFPISPASTSGWTRLSNASYDSVTNRIYIAQVFCCDGIPQNGFKPIIHVFQVNP
jgi:hypothetical protein